MQKQSGIYEIINTANGKRYIGQSQNMKERWAAHRWHLRRGEHHCQPLQHTWNKYGEGAFKFLPILTCQLSMLDFYEQQLLDRARPEYNVCPVAGSCRGTKHTPERRALLLGNTFSLGFKHPPEFGQAISERNKGRIQSKDHVAKSAAARTGGKRSDAARRNMSVSHVGTTRSPESRAKQAATNTGRKFPAAFGVAVSVAKRAASDAKHPPSTQTLRRRAAFDAANLG